MNRRQLLATFVACLVAAPVAWAQSYPTKPIRVIVGYTAGGAVDVVTRAVSQQLQASLGQPIVVDNITTEDAAMASSGREDTTATR